MTDEEKVQHAKELAARDAFEAYGTTLERLLIEYGLPVESVGKTPTHIHAAVMLSGSTMIGITCRWDFELRPEHVAAMLKQAKAAGRA